MQTIHHKKNEIQEVEFFKDKECTEAFDFRNAKNLYIRPFNGDCTPIFALSHKLSGLNIKAIIFTPIWHLGWYDGISPQTPVVTLNDVLCNDDLQNITLSKYIPEDNAVLFLSEQDMEKYKDCFPNNHIGLYTNDGSNYETFIANNLESLIDGIVEVKKGNTTIFLPHGTQSEIQKANEVGKYLEENFGIKPDVFALHWFKMLNNNDWRFNFLRNIIEEEENAKGIWHGNDFGKFVESKYEERIFINKIITTNSTGILKPEDSNERLQVIDAKEIFEEYLKEII